ncbi:hypothetical protein M378DRAFT_169245 [Amanita muscaria Koide BX008]|uniref:Uncharacterized protein n=1 Tax=Amanita muscaria (strain Koide BX008) TaxID=946122 RepID=A0A0C2WSX9_AMAMK|nr:hypothetical protein M378DRAFT_169245 [Amanita muscaria Koide BX008]
MAAICPCHLLLTFCTRVFMYSDAIQPFTVNITNERAKPIVGNDLDIPCINVP